MKLFKKIKWFKIMVFFIFGLQLNAQEDLENAIIFQDFPFTKWIENDKEVILEKHLNRRSRSFSNTKEVKDIFYHEVYDIDKNLGNLKPIYGGRISGFRITSESLAMNRLADDLVSLFKIQYLWQLEHYESHLKDKVDVTELYYVNNETSRILRTEIWKSEKFNFFGWGEHMEDLETNHLDIGKLELFKIKRIAIDAEGILDVKEPEKYINYALLTSKGFYRFNIDNVKDSVNFSGATKVYELTPYNKMVNYETTTGGAFLLTNNYDRNDVNYFVSSLDMSPFPNSSEEKIIELGNIIVWEKCDFIDEWTSLLLKQTVLAEQGLSKEELSVINLKTQILTDCIIIGARDIDENN